MEKVFDKEAVRSDLPGLVILSHGPLAVALKQTTEMIFRETPNLAAFSLEYGDEAENYANAFQEAIESYPKGCIVFVDIFGGTPCNQLLIYAKKKFAQLNIICGVNLPLLLAAISLRESMEGTVKELKDKVLESGEDYIRDISAFCG